MAGHRCSATDRGLSGDATLAEVLAAVGHDPGSDGYLLEPAEVIAELSPAYAHAFLATDGMLLTRASQTLISVSRAADG